MGVVETESKELDTSTGDTKRPSSDNNDDANSKRPRFEAPAVNADDEGSEDVFNSRSKLSIHIVHMMNDYVRAFQQRNEPLLRTYMRKLAQYTRLPVNTINYSNFVTRAKEFIALNCNGFNDSKSATSLVSASSVHNQVESPLSFILNKRISFFNDYPRFSHYMPTMSLTCIRKINAAFNELNSHQKNAFIEIHKRLFDSLAIDDDTVNADSSPTIKMEKDSTPIMGKEKVFPIREPFFGMLNSRSGTGKSTLMGVLGCSLFTSMWFVVYSNQLVTNASALHVNIKALTTCKFTMRTLRVPYHEAIHMFNFKKTTPLCKILQQMVKFVGSFKPRIDNDLDEDIIPYLIVFDEYTMLSPFTLVYLHMLSRAYRLNMLFVGDANQQRSMSTTCYHSMNNYQLLSKLTTCSLSLVQQVRMRDEFYINIIRQFEESLDRNRDNVSMCIKYKMILYEMMTENFFMNEHYKAFFIARTHVKLKERTSRCVKDAIRRNLPMVKCHFYGKKQANNKPVPVQLPTNEKYPPLLILMKNYPYIRYSLTSKSEEIVHFSRLIKYDNAEIISNTGKVEQVGMIPLNPANTIESVLKWYISHKVRYQLPLKYFSSTYCSAQGLTLDSHDLELDIDDTTANSVYVGLTRIRSASQLKRINTESLCSLAITHLKRDEYYYIVPESYKAVYMPKDTENMTQREIMNQFHSNLWRGMQQVHFRTIDVGPKIATYMKGHYLCRFLKAKYEQYLSYVNVDKSILYSSYERIKDLQFKTIESMSREVLHTMIQCDCDEESIDTSAGDDVEL